MVEVECDNLQCNGSYAIQKTIVEKKARYLFVNVMLFKLTQIVNNGVVTLMRAEKMDKSIRIENTVSIDDKQYSLVAVTCHIGEGSVNSGHYITYIKSGNNFIRYKDTERETLQFVEYCSASGAIEQPYILLYKQIENNR